MSTNDLSKSVIFPIGKKFESKKFNGTVWLRGTSLHLSPLVGYHLEE